MNFRETLKYLLGVGRLEESVIADEACQPELSMFKPLVIETWQC